MSIVSTTMCYPSPAAPTQGIFVWRRLREIHRQMPIRVVAPELWFPFFRGSGGRAPEGTGAPDEPPVWRPRMFYFPGILKRLDGLFFARAFQRGLERATRGEPATLIDAHFEWPDGVGAWRVARRLGVPFICTLRGKLVSQIEYASKRRQIREMLLGADALIAVSRALANLACDVAGRELAVRVIPNGVDGGVFRKFEAGEGRERILGPAGGAARGRASGPANGAACALNGWCREAKHVISVGHLQALKGFDRLVEVWPEVRRRSGDVRLALVGGGAGEPGYERQLRQQIESTGLGTTGKDRGAVTLAGRLAPEQVAAMLNAADLFVLASQSEGWCNAIVEALACGCPVVATDVGGNGEIVNDPALGRLVASGDRAALAEGICRALEQRWDRGRIAATGGRRDWQQTARECVDVMESVMRQGGDGGRAV
jgi:teichuronic acid biosynthesis glycosyltransferase TuaC